MSNYMTNQEVQSYNQQYIYNPEVGWREKTANEMPGWADGVGNRLDPVLGPPLQFVGEKTILFAKATLYTGLALTSLSLLSLMVSDLIESVR